MNTNTPKDTAAPSPGDARELALYLQAAINRIWPSHDTEGSTAPMPLRRRSLRLGILAEHVHDEAEKLIEAIREAGGKIRAE